MDYTVVILSEFVSCYPALNWSDWKDSKRNRMKSEGDHWSQATLAGTDIHDCLKSNKIDSKHLVQWKEAEETLYKVSLPKSL